MPGRGGLSRPVLLSRVFTMLLATQVGSSVELCLVPPARGHEALGHLRRDWRKGSLGTLLWTVVQDRYRYLTSLATLS